MNKRIMLAILDNFWAVVFFFAGIVALIVLLASAPYDERAKTLGFLVGVIVAMLVFIGVFAMGEKLKEWIRGRIEK